MISLTRSSAISGPSSPYRSSAASSGAAGRFRHFDLDAERTDLDLVLWLDDDAPVDRPSADAGAVRAAEIPQSDLALGDLEKRVATRNLGVLEHDVTLLAEDDLRPREGHRAGRLARAAHGDDHFFASTGRISTARSR